MGGKLLPFKKPVKVEVPKPPSNGLDPAQVDPPKKRVRRPIP